MHEVSNAAGELPGPLFPATVAEFEVQLYIITMGILVVSLILILLYSNKAFTNAQLDALAEFYGVGPAAGATLAKQRLLRPIIGDYRTDQ